MFLSSKQSPCPSQLKPLLSELNSYHKPKYQNTPSPTTYSESKFRTRSKKPKLQSIYDISFEKGLLTQHKIYFRNSLNKYVKEVSSALKLSHFPLVVSQLNQEEDSFENTELNKMIENCQMLDENEQNQLLEDLKSEDTLSSFISFMLKNIEDEGKAQLLFIIAYIWEEYLIQTREATSVKRIVNKINTFSSTKISQLMKICSYFTRKSTVTTPFTRFVHGLVQSMVLVIGEYYQPTMENVGDDILTPPDKYVDLTSTSDSK